MKKMLSFSLMLLLMIFSAESAEIKRGFTSSDYDQAEKAANFIKFHMTSTKMGVFTSSFDGYVKTFEFQAKFENQTLNNSTILFDVMSMDTDINARNDKMYDFCLNAKEYPQIKVTFARPLTLTSQELKQEPAMITIRGQAHPIKVDLKLEPIGKDLKASGRSLVKLSALKIPDASIAVATLHDDVEITFAVLIQL